jgi:hypothetical protein
MYTIFFTVGNRNSTKISNYKNKKIMTNELSSFDEFNGFYSILVNNRLYMPPNEGINWPLWPGFFKILPSNGWFNYSNNGIKHYLIKENHTL